MAVSPTPDQRVTGTVASVNPKGLKLDGHADWLNFSKFAQDIVPPARGQAVTLTLDRAGFVRSVETAEEGVGAISSQNGRSEPASGQHERNRTITRLAVLKAAAEFGAARPSLKSGDVLAIAASWERWVNRDEENTYDLTDAF